MMSWTTSCVPQHKSHDRCSCSRNQKGDPRDSRDKIWDEVVSIIHQVASRTVWSFDQIEGQMPRWRWVVENRQVRRWCRSSHRSASGIESTSRASMWWSQILDVVVLIFADVSMWSWRKCPGVAHDPRAAECRRVHAAGRGIIVKVVDTIPRAYLGSYVDASMPQVVEESVEVILVKSFLWDCSFHKSPRARRVPLRAEEHNSDVSMPHVAARSAAGTAERSGADCPRSHAVGRGKISEVVQIIRRSVSRSVSSNKESTCTCRASH